MKQATATQPPVKREAGNDAIRRFRVSIPEEELVDLRRRIAAMRWPEKETVADASQGVQLDTMQKLASYWAGDYDWRKCEARLNALPQFLTEIDGLDIHFVHVRSKHANALPMIVTHGWPGSVLEQLKIVGPLTDPTAHGGTAADAFDLVIPSMPGFGFSGKPASTGWDPPRIARAWTVLMKRLGYTRYVAQGGDWGALVTEQLGVLAPPELIAIHTNMPSAVPADEGQRAQWRAQALRWLRADLTAWTEVLERRDGKIADRVASKLARWQQDPDFAAVREQRELVKLPADERQEWRALWDDVELSIQRSRAIR